MDDQDAAVTTAIVHSIKAPVEQLEKEALIPQSTTTTDKPKRPGDESRQISKSPTTESTPMNNDDDAESGQEQGAASAKEPQPGGTTSKQVTILDPMEAHKQLGDCKEEDPAMSRVILKVYPRRWLVMAIVALLNNSNAMSWISYSPVANHVDAFYAQESAANYFSVIYLAITIPVGFLAMWGERRFGLRWAIVIAALANGLGALIRLSSSFLARENRFLVGIVGQGVAGIAYPFIMFLPSKVAAVWFPESQRAIATTIGLMANPLGIFLANIISPNIVSDPSRVPLINVVTAVPATLVAIAAVVFVRKSKPKLPPSISASAKSFDFMKGLRSCLTSRQYLILLVVMGGGMGMFNSLYTLMQQLLCPTGYPNTFAGTCAALMITGGVIGAFLSGTFVDRTKMYEEALKFSMALAVVCGLGFLQLTLHRSLGVLISIVAFLFGIFGMAAYPVGLELAAECTFPVTTTTSSGLIVIVGQYFASPLQPDYMQYQVCRTPEDGLDSSTKPMDWMHSIIVMSVVAASMAVILFLFFRPKYRRSMAESGGAVGRGGITAGGGKKGGNGLLAVTVDEIDRPADEEMDLREAKPAATDESGSGVEK